MIFNPKQLANQLRLIRTKNNWTQAEVAKRVGLKQATLSNFENDPDRCQLQTLFKILQAMQLSMQINEINPSLSESPSDNTLNDEDW